MKQIYLIHCESSFYDWSYPVFATEDKEYAMYFRERVNKLCCDENREFYADWRDRIENKTTEQDNFFQHRIDQLWCRYNILVFDLKIAPKFNNVRIVNEIHEK